MRTYTNARGSGKVFSVDLADDSVRSRFIFLACALAIPRADPFTSRVSSPLRIAPIQGEIRASAFNETAERLFPLLERGKVYIISRGSVRVVNAQQQRFTQVRNAYEISFDQNTTVTEVRTARRP